MNNSRSSDAFLIHTREVLKEARLRRLAGSYSSKNTASTARTRTKSAKRGTSGQRKSDIINQQRNAEKDTILHELRLIQAKIKNILLDTNSSLSESEYRNTKSFMDGSILMLKKLNDQREPAYEREARRKESRSLSSSVRFDLSQNELYTIYEI